MRKLYKMKINGKAYEVELEEVAVFDESSSSTVAISNEEEKNSKNSAPSIARSGNSTDLTAPMPGTLLDIKVKVGDQVNEGDVVLILEAMKMETEIVAPVSGQVSVVAKNKGDQVVLGELIIAID
jgi:biotin carboxyl carrier protein